MYLALDALLSRSLPVSEWDGEIDFCHPAILTVAGGVPIQTAFIWVWMEMNRDDYKELSIQWHMKT